MRSKALICNEATLHIVRFYKSYPIACRALARMKNSEGLCAMKIEKFDKLNTEVEVTCLMSGKQVKIHRSDLGGPCDPSTERYWSM